MFHFFDPSDESSAINRSRFFGLGFSGASLHAFASLHQEGIGFASQHRREFVEPLEGLLVVVADVACVA